MGLYFLLPACPVGFLQTEPPPEVRVIWFILQGSATTARSPRRVSPEPGASGRQALAGPGPITSLPFSPSRAHEHTGALGPWTLERSPSRAPGQPVLPSSHQQRTELMRGPHPPTPRAAPPRHPQSYTRTSCLLRTAQSFPRGSLHPHPFPGLEDKAQRPHTVTLQRPQKPARADY